MSKHVKCSQMLLLFPFSLITWHLALNSFSVSGVYVACGTALTVFGALPPSFFSIMVWSTCPYMWFIYYTDVFVCHVFIVVYLYLYIYKIHAYLLISFWYINLSETILAPVKNRCTVLYVYVDEINCYSHTVYITGNVTYCTSAIWWQNTALNTSVQMKTLNDLNYNDDGTYIQKAGKKMVVWTVKQIQKSKTVGYRFLWGGFNRV